jgi:hypothetical protein
MNTGPRIPATVGLRTVCFLGHYSTMVKYAIGPAKKIKVESVLYGASCSTTDTRTEFDVSFEIDQPELEQVSVSQYENFFGWPYCILLH